MIRFERLAIGVALALFGAFGIGGMYRMELLIEEVRDLSVEVHRLANAAVRSEQQRMVTQMNELSTSWPTTDGIWTTTTSYQAGWTVAQWEARHAQRVAEDKAAHPVQLPD